MKNFNSYNYVVNKSHDCWLLIFYPYIQNNAWVTKFEKIRSCIPYNNKDEKMYVSAEIQTSVKYFWEYIYFCLLLFLPLCSYNWILLLVLYNDWKFCLKSMKTTIIHCTVLLQIWNCLVCLECLRASNMSNKYEQFRWSSSRTKLTWYNIIRSTHQ